MDKIETTINNKNYTCKFINYPKNDYIKLSLKTKFLIEIDKIDVCVALIYKDHSKNIDIMYFRFNDSKKNLYPFFLFLKEHHLDKQHYWHFDKIVTDEFFDDLVVTMANNYLFID